MPVTDGPGTDTDLAWPADGGHGRARTARLRRLALRGVLLVLVPAGLAIVAVAGSQATYRSVQAAQGHGAKGYFVCASGARGEFRLPDGQVTRPYVTFADPPPGLRPGAVLAALDTGDVTYVFARHGSRHWITNAAVMSLVAAAFVAWAWFVPLRPRRLRRLAASGAPRRPTVQAAAANPEWASLLLGPLNGDVVTKRVNTALRRAADKAAYPVLVTVCVPTTDSDRAMYPVSGDSAQLAELTATITRLVGDRGVLAGTMADSTAWAFWIYARTAGWVPEFDDALRSALTDHMVSVGVGRAERWRAYKDLSRGVNLRRRDRILVAALVPLVFGLLAARYGVAWAAIGVVAVGAWLAPIALVPAQRMQARVLPAQLAHPVFSFLAAFGIFTTLFFPLGAFVVHPASPWACVVGAAVVALAVVAAVWPVQRKYYDRMRRRAATQPLAEAQVPAMSPADTAAGTGTSATA